MANITLNIEGDLNIYVSEEDGQPDSLYLDGGDSFPETLRIHLEADSEDAESKAEVIYAIPGAAAFSNLPMGAYRSRNSSTARMAFSWE